MDEFDNFMQKVTEVQGIVRGLSSKSPSEIEKATRKADIYLTENKQFDENKVRVKLDKTIINTKAYNSSPDNDTTSTEAFMSYTEKDAKERAQNRHERKESAEYFKKKGNAAFKVGEFERALDLYNKAILEVKDSCLLYTNRAVTYMRLGLYKRALEDCIWALKVNENSLKAWLLKGRAHQQLGETEQAALCFKEAELHNPHRCDYIQEYVNQWKEDQV